MTTDTTATNRPKLTPRGVDYGQEYSSARQNYEEFHDRVYEDDEVVIFADYARYAYSEIAKETNRSWEAVNGIFHDVARDKVQDSHLVFAAVDPIVLTKPQT